VQKNMPDFTALARENVAQMPPYIPGKPILEVQQEYGLDKVVKLSSNECPFPLPRGWEKRSQRQSPAATGTLMPCAGT
jgi:histidinol-phosphate/aromatic aminotransferase/cobyric acid decarboxylase-like protein